MFHENDEQRFAKLITVAHAAGETDLDFRELILALDIEGVEAIADHMMSELETMFSVGIMAIHAAGR